MRHRTVLRDAARRAGRLRHQLAENSADGRFTARADLAASMLQQLRSWRESIKRKF